MLLYLPNCYDLWKGLLPLHDTTGVEGWVIFYMIGGEGHSGKVRNSITRLVFLSYNNSDFLTVKYMDNQEIFTIPLT